MATDPKRLPAAFWRSASGAEPVREWLRDLEPAARRAIGLDIMRAEYGWPVGMPLCRSLGQGALGGAQQPPRRPNRPCDLL